MDESSWDESFDQAFNELELECEAIVRGLTVRIWDSILAKSPQYHGRFVASWSYQLDSPGPTDRSGEVGMEPGVKAFDRYSVDDKFFGLYAGHGAAINVANAASLGVDKAFRLGQTVYMTNGVDHGEGPYSYDIEVGNIHLRAENLPGAPVSRTMDLVENSYAEISEIKAQSLKAARIL